MISHIRNFSIIAHIDHGKSTLADALIRHCGGLSEREMCEQVLDSMDLERERGITIKSQTVALNYENDGVNYTLNLIDTPGHVDFSHEVARSLAACEGALLLVDATQGVQAQTVANCIIADELGLSIIPVLTKMDLPAAHAERVCAQIEDIIGIDTAGAIAVSAKRREGIDDVLARVVRDIPPPEGDGAGALQARVVDAWFDAYLGVVNLIRVHQGRITRRDKIIFAATETQHTCESLGVFLPKLERRESLSAGEVGCLITGIKNIRDVTVGDTVINDESTPSLPGLADIKPRLFATFYPVEPNQYHHLRQSLEKLQLNDASLCFEPESSPALGFGLRCGFLGSLHLEVVQERLEREWGANIIATAPGVVYEVLQTDGSIITVDSPVRLPDTSRIREIREPIAAATIIVPNDYLGKVMALVNDARGIQQHINYTQQQAVMSAEIPLSELIFGFFDTLKSQTHGHGSLEYDFSEYRAADIVRLDIRINGEVIDALAVMVPRSQSLPRGRALVEKFRQVIPRQMFDVAVQASIGSKIIARETVRAMRKNVLAKCYGGDVTRKRKLLEKQKAGKKRMKQIGQVQVPQEAFLAALKK